MLRLSNVRLISVFIAGLFGLLVLVPAIQVSAASNALGVRPRVDFVIKPGETVRDTVNVKNLSKTDELKLDISVVDFGAKNESGAPTFLLGRKEPTSWSLKPYLTIAKTATIPAGKSSDIPFSIALPAKLGAGSYYGAIKYSSAGSQSNENVSLASSSATLLFVRVPGNTEESLILKSFGPFTPDKSGESGTFGTVYGGEAPKYLAFRLQNMGNIVSRPTGSLDVKGLFGRKVATVENVNPLDSLVLIGQTRRFDICMNEQKTNRTDETGQKVEDIKCNPWKLTPGRYTAQLALVYGENGSASHELHKSATFWYMPLWFVIAVIVGLALIIGLIVLIIVLIRKSRRNRKYRR